MKIKKIKIKNFRSYKDEVEIELGDLSAFVGKNDIGKSTVLEDPVLASALNTSAT